MKIANSKNGGGHLLNNAFTLIELLAVIIILAIVALIATPIILDVVEDARISAGRSESQMILGGINNYCASSEMKKQMGTLGSEDIDCSIKTSFTEEEIGKMLNLGNAKVISNSYSNGKVTELVIKSNNHKFTLCPSGQFAMDGEECDGEVAVITTGPIKDVVLSNFPYLATNGNGCVTPTDNNYSYMGGCYLRGSSQSGKDIFIAGLNGAPGLDSIDIINEKFFDSEGNFIAENFENWALTDGGISEDDLTSAGVGAVFELIYQTTPDELFSQKATVTNNSLWYSGFLWRIMGINTDGTVRLITDENLTGIHFGASDTAENWDDSYARDWLNNYFYPKLKGNNIIKEEIWCSETTTDENSVRTTCTNNLSKEKSKVGLITLDEYNLAGGLNSYLNIGLSQWAMTPYSSSYSWIVGSANYSKDMFNADGVRAVINVNSDVIITGGNGTLGATWSSQTGPYVLNEDKNMEVTGKLNEKATSGEYVLFVGKKYRVVDKDNNGNTKLILDGYYEENENIFEMEYGDNNEFSTTTGIGQKLNGDVLNWITNNNDNEKIKLMGNYTWYQNIFGYGYGYVYDYKVSLDEENPTRSIQATVGLIRVGEILSSQSGSILTNGYTTISSYNNSNWYWTMTPHTGGSSSWSVNNYGYADYSVVSGTCGLRPVIVVNTDVNITGGNGTWSNPYKI